MEETLQDLPKPVGDFIFENATGVQLHDGTYYHYAKVCTLLNKYASIKETEIHNKAVQGCIDKINTFATVDITVKFWISELEKLKR